MTLAEAFAAAPIIAIVRGVAPEQAVDVAEALYAEGVRIVEIPLNSPNPLQSLERVVAAVGDRMVCGSGTVLDPEAVDRVADAGGRILVSPNTDLMVIERALARGLTPMPGWATPTEALAAYRAGARWLKLFPAVTLGPQHLRQTLAVLAKDVVPLAVGGVGPAAFGDWLAVGARGFGLGSELYKAGDTAEVVAGKARACMAAVSALKAQGALTS
jgi:2-dehydro-3-deoxyphosphogalactonate aldolase